MGRHPCGNVICAAVAWHLDCADMGVSGVRQLARDCRRFVRHQAGGGGDCACGRLAHRLENTEKCGTARDCRRCVFRNHRYSTALPSDRFGRGRNRAGRGPGQAGQISQRRHTRRGPTHDGGSSADRRRYADAAACAFLRAQAGKDSGNRNRFGDSGLDRDCVRLRRLQSACADGLVFYQGGDADVWRRLRGFALCLSGCGGKLSMADGDANDRRPRARRNHAWPADHDRVVRRVCRRLDQGAVR
jgi:hypothetical protein